MAKKQKYYVVWDGHEPGIYNTWEQCQIQIKNYPGAKYKSFKTLTEAEEAYHSNYGDYIGSKVSKSNLALFSDEIIQDSISVDAACSGNPGIMEYQGVHTSDKTVLFKIGPYTDGTNNVGEFLAIVHALAMCKKANLDTLIYTDSRTAQAWVRNKYAKTNLKKTKGNPKLLDLLARAEKWLRENQYPNEIAKWNTEKWGEIPADFGRK